MKTFGIVVVIFLGLGVLTIGGLFLRTAFLPVRVVDRAIGTTEGIIDKTLTAENAIFNYEWFKQTYEDIKALNAKTEIAVKAVETFKIEAGDREKWTFEDKTEYSRLSAIEQGLRSQLEDVMATYNARSKMANRNIFQDGKIPTVLQIGSNWLK